MDRTNENTQQQKPRISRMAIASPLVVILGFLTAIGLLFPILWLEGTFLGYFLRGLLRFSVLFIFFVSPPIALILAIVSARNIHKSKGTLKGYLFSIPGAGLGFIGILCVFGALILLPARSACPRAARKVLCGANLVQLGKAMQAYSDRYDQQYPTPDVWCDLLIEYADVNEENFLCKGALKNGDKGPCHYALNPNCFPNSPNDVVLIFETKGGWNKYGGAELMTAEHHEDEGCNVLFNNGRVNFIITYQGILQPDKLRWDNKPKDDGQK